MRYFSILCFLLMITAGTYGAFDLSRDLQNGTMIHYEGDGSYETPALSFVDGLEFMVGLKTAKEIRPSSFYMDETEFSRGDGMYTMGGDTLGGDSTAYDFKRDLNHFEGGISSDSTHADQVEEFLDEPGDSAQVLAQRE
jgi:hypothetical protein